jgi:hypothetical protein
MVKEWTRRGVAQRTAITTMGGLAGSLMISSPSFLSYVTPSGRATGCSAIQNRVPTASEHTKQCLHTSARTLAHISRRAHGLDQDSAAHYSHHSRQVRCAPENGARGRPVCHLSVWPRKHKNVIFFRAQTKKRHGCKRLILLHKHTRVRVPCVVSSKNSDVSLTVGPELSDAGARQGEETVKAAKGL